MRCGGARLLDVSTCFICNSTSVSTCLLLLDVQSLTMFHVDMFIASLWCSTIHISVVNEMNGDPIHIVVDDIDSTVCLLIVTVTKQLSSVVSVCSVCPLNSCLMSKIC